tara:strand:- start:4784 stop:5437 length:654 start_codon:yes stop_codon:yes gene_type:complete
MKISTGLREVLKNFAVINPSIWVDEGNVLNTISPAKTIVAKAVVDESFDTPFGIYDLNQFLGCLGLVDNAELALKDTYMNISGEKSSLRYGYVEKDIITTPPAKELQLPSEDVDFVLTNENLQKIMQASNIMQLPNVVVEVKNNKVHLVACDVKNESGNRFEIFVGEHIGEFSFTYRAENLKVMPFDYNVVISDEGISKFVAKSAQVEYFIALERKS